MDQPQLRQRPQGFIINPRTGRPVGVDGRIGKQLERERIAALERERIALPAGRAIARPLPVFAGPAPEPVVLPDNQPRAARLRVNGALRTQTYQIIRPVTTLNELASILAQRAAQTPNFRHNNILYRSEADDGAIIRAVKGRTRNEILAELERIEHGDLQQGGSDLIPDGYKIDTINFSTSYTAFPRGGAAKFTGVSRTPGRKHPHFKLVELSGKAAEGDCLFAVMRAVAREYKLDVPRTLNKTLRRELDLPDGPIEASDAAIDKVARRFGLRVRVITGMAVPGDAQREFDDNAARQTERNLCRTVAAPIVIAEGGEADAPPCDVYLADHHYEFIETILEPIRTCPVTGDMLVDGKELTRAAQKRRVIAQGRTWLGEAHAPAEPRKNLKELVIVFDYETVYKPDEGRIVPYALGYLVFDPAEPEAADGDFSGADMAARVVHCTDRTSRWTITAPLLETLRAAPENVRYTLVSFNGVRFDHFLLAEAAHRAGKLTDIFATSAGLRTVTIGRHRTLDVAKLIPGSTLKDACEEFKTSPVKVEGFSHVLPQRAYEEERFDQWLGENAEKLAEYLAGDVLSTASLLMKLRGAVMKSVEIDVLAKTAPQTAGGLAWHNMTDKCEIPMPVHSHETDLMIRSAITGGRVQVYREKDAPAVPVKVEGQLRMVDFASLYPFIMVANDKGAKLFPEAMKFGHFPTGRLNGEPVVHATPEAAELAHSHGGVGVYAVTIHSQPWPNILPKREEGAPLDWTFQGEFDTTCTHIDIALIREGGGAVTIKSALVWENTSRGLFKPFIEPHAAAKDEQDKYKKAGDPQYNAALRQFEKLIQNSASGKCCQNNYDDVTVIATGTHQQLEAERKMSPDHPVEWVPIGAETCILIGKKPKASVYNRRTAKPSILAVLIYSYSRALVYRVLCKYNILYSDTDSGLFRAEDYERLRADFPSLDPDLHDCKKLGDLEEELGRHHTAAAYLIAPKDYAVVLKDEAGRIIQKGSKLKIKGVNQRTDRFIQSESVEAFRAMTIPELTVAYNTDATEQSERLSDVAVVEKFFQRRCEGKRAHVICSQITRSYRTTEAAFELRQQFLIKEL